MKLFLIIVEIIFSIALIDITKKKKSLDGVEIFILLLLIYDSILLLINWNQLHWFY
jgi:hypothetical protein